MFSTLIIIALIVFLVVVMATIGKIITGKPPEVFSTGLPKWALWYFGPVFVVAILAAALLYASGQEEWAEKCLWAAGIVLAAIASAWAGSSLAAGLAKLAVLFIKP